MALKIVCDAVPFGFGPASKLHSLLLEMKPPRFRVEIVGTGTTAQFLRGCGHRVIEVDTESATELETVRGLVEGADLCLSVMNPTFLAFVQRLGRRTAAVDSLFWMWDKVPAPMARSDYYFIQRFAGCEERVRSVGDPALRNPILVGPIVSRRSRGAKTTGRSLLINFGGLESKLLPRSRVLYPFVIGAALEASLRSHDYDRVVMTGHRAIIRDLGKKLAIPRARFGFMPHDEFMQALKSAALVLTSPGLTVGFEAASFGARVAFLPPQNYSQVGNLATLARGRACVGSLPWDAVFDGAQVPLGLAEPEGVAAVLKLIERLRDDAEAHGRVATWIGNVTTLTDCSSSRTEVSPTREASDGVGAIIATLRSSAVRPRLGTGALR